MDTNNSFTYANSGVDIDKEADTVKTLINQLSYVRKGIGQPITSIGHYSGIIDLGAFCLGMTTDGVGSKVLIAQAMNKWNTVGIDCIAMNVNDLLAMGIEPIAFVDYLALEEHDNEIIRQIGEGLNEGARLANISIIGGETATLPDIICGYGVETGFDLAGTCVGVVQKDKIITGEKIVLGDVIIGIPSSGLHSNGFTLVRKIIENSKHYGFHSPCPFDPKDKLLGEVFLTPTRIYMEILELIKVCDVHGMAHITGGGLSNLSRLTNLGFHITNPIDVPPIFFFMQSNWNLDDTDMYKTFNMGMGFVVIVSENEVDKACKITGGQVVGKIVESGIKVYGLNIS